MLSSQQRFKEFPITRTKVFLAHAAVSPFSRRVCKAIQNYCQNNADLGQWEYTWGNVEQETRNYAAAILNCSNDEVAFVSSTSMGLSLISSGLSWQYGDNVIVADGDFPANIYPWLNIEKGGVKVKFIPRRVNGSVIVDDLIKLIDGHTRLVSLSSVNFVTGYLMDIDAIGAFLNSKGILFCVDAIQSLGVLPFNSRYVDFAVASSHKWMMGPMGIGIFYIKKKHFDKLNPVLCGWKSMNDNHNYLNYHWALQESAKRYEPGTMNGMGLVGLHAALGLLLEEGIDNIAGQIGDLRYYLIDKLHTLDLSVLSPVDSVSGSGIISFSSDRLNIPELREYLDKQNYVVSLRDTLDRKKCIRISPHFYNTEQEIESLIGTIAAYITEKVSYYIPDKTTD